MAAIRDQVLRDKSCENCGSTFTPASGRQLFCAECRTAREPQRQLLNPRKRPPKNPWIRMQEEHPCRRCGAQPETQCVTRNGTFALHPHKERYDDAGLANSVEETDRVRWYATCASYQRRKRATNRQRVFDHYGWACACCGSTDNLTIDHIDGSGKRQRGEISDSGGAIRTWLIKNNFPSGFQTLCFPCNNSKSTGERCRLLHDSCPTCHRPFDETSPVLDSQGYRIWT